MAQIRGVFEKQGGLREKSAIGASTKKLAGGPRGSSRRHWCRLKICINITNVVNYFPIQLCKRMYIFYIHSLKVCIFKGQNDNIVERSHMYFKGLNYNDTIVSLLVYYLIFILILLFWVIE